MRLGVRHTTMQWNARGDAGQIQTTIFLAETALCLALDRNSLPLQGGVLSPVSATGGELLAARLRAARWEKGDPPAIEIDFA